MAVTVDKWHFDSGSAVSGQGPLVGGYYPWDVVVVLPDGYNPDRATPYPWVLECHGAGADAHYYDVTDPAWASANGVPVANKYAAMGYVLVAAYQGGPRLWGNDASLTRIYQSFTWAKGYYNLEPTSVLSGQSMGGTVIANLFARHPSDFWAVAGMHPALWLYDMYYGANGSANYSADLNTVYGSWAGTGGTTSPLTTHRPEDMVGLIAAAGVPWHIWHGELDTTVNPVQSTKFRDGVNAVTAGLVVVDVVAGGTHSSGTVTAYVDGIQGFIESVRPPAYAFAFDILALETPPVVNFIFDVLALARNNSRRRFAVLDPFSSTRL